MSDPNKRGRYYVIVSADENNLNATALDILLARGTLYSSRRRAWPCSSDCPIPYADHHDSRVFPTQMRFKYSFFQAPNISSLAKHDLADPYNYRFIGAARRHFMPALDHELRAVLRGYDGPHPTVPSTRRWPPSLRTGNIVDVHDGAHTTRCAVVSDDTAHDLYIHPVVLLVPMSDESKADLADRFDCLSMYSVDLGFPGGRSFTLNSQLSPDELEELRSLCELVLGV